MMENDSSSCLNITFQRTMVICRVAKKSSMSLMEFRIDRIVGLLGAPKHHVADVNI
jgi:hypothetical protein